MPLLFLFFLSLLLKMFTGNKKDTREQKIRVLWWLFCEDQKSLRKG